MTDQYELAAGATYILNILKGVPMRSSLASSVAQWLVMEGHDFIPERNNKTPSDIDADVPTLITNLESFIYKRRHARPGLFRRNIERLQTILDLDETEVMLIELAVRIRVNIPLMRFICHIHHSIPGDSLELAALMLRCPKPVLARRLQKSSKLCTTGIIEAERGYAARSLDDVLNLSYVLFYGVLQPVRKNETLHGKLVGKPLKSNLLWDDFSHMGEEREFLARLIKNAAEMRVKGVNILLYGPPGTGKTEFCKTLSKQAGLPLYAVAEETGGGMEAGREERLRSLRLVNTLLENQGNALLLFDEMEDILHLAGSAQAGSKVFMNRMLENNSLPTFWTANNISGFDKALLRRMTLAIEMKEPSRKDRSKVWKRMLKQERLNLPEKEIDALVQEFNDAPAIAGNAIKAAKLAGGNASQVRFAITNARKVMRNPSDIFTPTRTEDFDPAFINANTSLRKITDCVSRLGAPRNFSLCLYGPPGTGKTAYTRYLASCLGLEIMHIRASDLLSKWVGDTEKGIAAAFQKAHAEGAFLIFDEADSLLHDRQHAQRSWEVSQVNEMLTWMENHPLPFACTTNLMDRLDSASLRRFTFKIGFDYMTEDQVADCFIHFFKQAMPAGACGLNRLTPGDFEVVRRRATIMGDMMDADAILCMLRQEQEGKPSPVNPIGFLAIH